MASGGVTGYAAINARVRVKYATLLGPQDYATLAETPDFAGLIAQLKHTAYEPYLETMKDKDFNPRRAEFEIKRRLADSYVSIIQTAPENTKPLVTHLYRFFEIDNLKAVLRGIVSGASWDRIRYVLFPLGSYSAIPAQAMVEAGNVAAAVELLRGTVYYETVSHAMRRYNAEGNLFPLEVAIDLFHWRKLWTEVQRLSGLDRTMATRVIGALLDMDNLMWAIRYRVYHNLSEEELINYTLPFGFRVHDSDIRSVAAGADIAQIVQRIYPNLHDVETMLQNPREGLPQLELALQRELMNTCRAAFLGDPFQIGVPLAYLILTQLEIQDLTVLIEAKAAGMPADEFRSYLITGTVRRE
jgi:V/A-type H+/Na+-transporting ATPase subunit C